MWTLEKIDEEILKTRDKKRYKCIRFEERTGVTIFGEFTIKRRLYKDTETNTYHFLLDEALGWASRQRLSPKMREVTVDLATEVPFRRAARIMSQLVLIRYNDYERLGNSQTSRRSSAEGRRSLTAGGFLKMG
ncbi:MAG: UPF0236 family protein [Thermoanaerobacterales bacterium]|nr:UPF0236 family protein [Thermoanaerobacterales bacterium]